MSRTGKKLPNTLIIGVQKSATTWLSKRLSQHPDVYMVPGEVHYFDHENKFSKGVNWYSSLFKDVENESILCEKSGAYFWTTCEGVKGEPADKPQRIKALLPEVKLIVILRNPVVRAISGWNHNIRSGAIRPSFDINKIFSLDYSDLVKQHGILTRGLYHQQLVEYLKHFSNEQILTLFFETDVVENPTQGLAKVTKFLEIDSEFSFDKIESAENRLKMTNFGVWARYFSDGLINKAMYKADMIALSKLPLPTWKPAYPNTDTLDKLYEYYRAENTSLSKLLGNIPSGWTI